MTKKKTPIPNTPSEPDTEPAAAPAEERVEETPFEAVASICSVLVVVFSYLPSLARIL